jgi:KUP system potassium uptake protein
VEQGRLTNLGDGIFQIIARYGYMQTPHVPAILSGCQNSELKVDPKRVSFYLGRETILTTGLSRMSLWRKKLFVLLSRNTQPATAFFGIPPDCVIEVGLQLEI